MATAIFEYDEKNDIVKGLFEVIAKMAGVSVFFSKEKSKLSEREEKMIWLRKEAIALNKSINKKEIIFFSTLPYKGMPSIWFPATKKF